MNFWSNRSIFLTGATGLVGYWLTKQLVDLGAYVVTLVRDQDFQSPFFSTELYKQVTVISGELEMATVERALTLHEVDTVFHLGAQTLVGPAFRNPLETFESNIRGSYHLLEACRHQAKYLRNIVVASTDKAYGTSPVLPYKENMPLVGKYPYDVSKTCTDLIASSYYHTYDLPINIVRCGNIYGGGDLNWSRIIPGTIKSFLNGESPLIRSNGLFIRDYFYVKDAAQAYLDLSEKGPDFKGEAFNFASGEPLTVLSLVKILAELMGTEDLEPKVLDQTQAEIEEQYLCYQKAQDLLNWTPQYSLKEGLQETLEWYQAYLQKDPTGICV